MHGAVATTGDNSKEMTPLKDPVEESKNGVQFKKIKDRSPHIKAAGIMNCKFPESAKDCMICPDKEISPEVIKKFHAFITPAPGAQKVFYGKASDPERELAAKICHGVTNKMNVTSKELISPPANTNYHNKVEEIKEKNYASKKNAPLGKCRQQQLFAPKDIKSCARTLEEFVHRHHEHVSDLVNPPLKYQEILEAADKDHKLYVRSHREFYPGEQVKRNYTFPTFDPRRTFGESVCHWNDGRDMRTTLNWATLTEDKNAARIVPKSQEDFRERTQTVVSKPLDP